MLLLGCWRRTTSSPTRRRLHAVALARPAAAARAGLVTFGMRPTTPETGYGYIARPRPDPAAPAGVHAVARFVEKPDAETAERYRRRRAASLEQRHVRRHRRDPARRAGPARAGGAGGGRAGLAAATRDLDFVRLGAAAFAAAPSISIDYAVMEKTDRAAVVPAASSAGPTSAPGHALWDVGARDGAGNAAVGPVEMVDADGCYVRSEGILTGVVGARGRGGRDHGRRRAGHAARPRAGREALVEQLKRRGRKEATEHRRVYRPWGHYEGLIQGERFQVKKIQVRPGRKAVAAEALPPRRALGGGERHRRSSSATTRRSCCARTRASTCRSAACTGWRIRG